MSYHGDRVQGTYFDHNQRQNPRWSSASALAHGPQVNTPASQTGNNPFMKTQAMMSYSKTEDILNQALASALDGVAYAHQPANGLFPPREGFERREVEVTDVLQMGRKMGRDARFDYSGVTNTYRGTSRPGLGSV